MKTVLFRAPSLSQSGYGVHARQVFKWLLTRPDLKVYTQVVNWGDTPWYVSPGSCDGLIGRVMAATNSVPQKCDVSIQLQLPDEWDPNLGSVNIGMTALVETDTCNPEWVERCNRMSAVVLPSRFTRDVLLKTSQMSPLRTRVEVVPETFPDTVIEGSEIPQLDLKTSFNFLIVSQMTATDSTHDRKNILNTIKWLCEEFKDDPDVGIIVKTNSGRATTIDKALTRNAMKAEVDKIKTRATVYMLHGDVSEREMMGLYRHPTVKGLVSLTRGEGFGLPLLEAAASGLPVIATGWSAHTEFLGLGKYVSIGYDLVPLHESRCDGRIFVKGSRWANPSESDFKKRIRKFKNSPDVPRQWAAELMQTVRKSYGWPAVKEQYDRVLLPIIG